MPDDTALPPLPEYAGQVREAADSIMDTGGEPLLLGSEIRAEVVEAFHKAGNSALLAACGVVGEARQRRSVGVFYQRAAYDLQERRVAEFIARQTGIGAGLDPVGFLIASNAFMAGERKQAMRRMAALEEQIRAAGSEPLSVPAEDSRASDAYADAFASLLDGCALDEETVYADGKASLTLRVGLPAGVMADPSAVLALEERAHAAVRAVDASLAGRVALAYEAA